LLVTKQAGQPVFFVSKNLTLASFPFSKTQFLRPNKVFCDNLIGEAEVKRVRLHVFVEN
jgi:hypothetical protein